VPSSNEVAGSSLALDAGGNLAFTWISRGQARLAWYRHGRWRSERLGNGGDNGPGISVAFGKNRKPVVGWTDSSCAWVKAERDSTPHCLESVKPNNASIRLLQTGRREVLAFVGIGLFKKKKRIDVFALGGGGWRREASLAADPDAAIARWGKTGYLLLYRDTRGRLTVELHRKVRAKAVRFRMSRQFLGGEIAQLTDGSIGLLYGARYPATGKRNLEFATLRRGRFSVRKLITNLQCDVGAQGIGFLDRKTRLVYGYGCDVGWRVHNVQGKTTYDPFTRGETPVLTGLSSAGGRLAYAYWSEGSGRVLVRVLSP
jgi:hypothetical protein